MQEIDLSLVTGGKNTTTTTPSTGGGLGDLFGNALKGCINGAGQTIGKKGSNAASSCLSGALGSLFGSKQQ